MKSESQMVDRMISVLYLTTWDFENENSDGVCKKIKSQISEFERSGFNVDVIYVRGSKLIYKKAGVEKVIAKLGSIKKTPAYIKMYRYIKDARYDWIYNRHGKFDFFYFRVLKRLKHNGARILIEVPTYPYDNERLHGFLYWVMFNWDRVYIPRVAPLIDRIVAPWNGDYIWGVRTLNIRNGIDVKMIPLRQYRAEPETDAGYKRIVLGTAAVLQFYNGFERLFRGIQIYYANGGDWDIQFRIAGDGPEYKNYEQMIKGMNLSERVFLLGRLESQELDSFYNDIDIGVCSLGIYKNGVALSSELKSREYLSRGVPFILGCDLDVEGFLTPDMFYKVPNDDSIISIADIIGFYERIRDSYEEIGKRMRSIAERTVAYSVAYESVISYMNEIYR